MVNLVSFCLFKRKHTTNECENDFKYINKCENMIFPTKQFKKLFQSNEAFKSSDKISFKTFFYKVLLVKSFKMIFNFY